MTLPQDLQKRIEGKSSGIHRSLWFLNFIELSHLGDFLLVHVLYLFPRNSDCRLPGRAFVPWRVKHRNNCTS